MNTRFTRTCKRSLHEAIATLSLVFLRPSHRANVVEVETEKIECCLGLSCDRFEANTQRRNPSPHSCMGTLSITRRTINKGLGKKQVHIRQHHRTKNCAGSISCCVLCFTGSGSTGHKGARDEFVAPDAAVSALPVPAVVTCDGRTHAWNPARRKYAPNEALP